MTATAGTGALHPLLHRAARGELPPWSQAGPRRRDHIRRVVELLGEWAGILDLPQAERLRWLAAGTLHDALRDADPDALRDEVPPELRDLPGSLLHGPAAAVRLRDEGVADPGLLRAVAFHTLGHPELDGAGRALYAADFLEPGRTFRRAWRRGLASRYPEAPEEVLVEVVRARVERLLGRGGPLRPETVAFWNTLVGG